MTYAEIKNKFTTPESIDNRINVLKEIEDSANEKLDARVNEQSNEIAEMIQKLLPSTWHLTKFTPDFGITIASETDSFYSIDIYAKYSLNYEYKKEGDPEYLWNFEMNVSACGSFNIFDENNEITKYYSVVTTLMTKKEEMKKIEEKLREFADEYHKFQEDMRNVKSETKQLEILKNSISVEKEKIKYAEAAKNAEDKTQIIIINKKVAEENAVGTHRGTPITVHSLPMPNDSYVSLSKACKKMTKEDPTSRYIATEIRYVKFN